MLIKVMDGSDTELWLFMTDPDCCDQMPLDELATMTLCRDGYSNSTQCYLLPPPIKFKHYYNCPEFRER